MAAIPNTAFELRISNHIWEKQKNVTGLYQNSGTNEECPAGFLVQETSLLPNEGYNGLNNENAWIMGAASDATETIYASNTFNVSELQDALGNVYKVGSNTLGLSIPAGQRGTYTRLDEGDMARFGVGNFTATPGEGMKYAVIANGLLTAQESAPTTLGTLYFEIMSSGNFTQGAYNSFAYYLLRVKRVRTSA